MLAGAVRRLIKGSVPLQRHPLGGEEEVLTGNLDPRRLSLVGGGELHGQEVVVHTELERGLSAGTEWPLLELPQSQAESLSPS